MLNVLIIGANSAIAEATARIYANRGARLFLVARNSHKLADLTADLSVRGASAVGSCVLDVGDVASQAGALEQAKAFLSSIDVALIAHGTLPKQEACEASVDTALAEFWINASSTIALLTQLGNTFEAKGSGTIAVISSVAGDRGRASNYLYGAAKSAVSTFLSGMGQRLKSKGITILNIKPGFVDTPMTSEFKKGPLWAKPDAVAKGIVRAIDTKKAVVYLPGFWRLIMLVIRHIPETVFRRIRL
ncbi:SDR family oxidoreductase [Dyella japonica]|uniref:Short-chain dehydrogenase n=1 Tax=Dyella japonica A8 TaxID=1217721 RepID=A0A075K5E0_9GAMM|nr:SDR family oxidoreductase [Dyella japonica]AIF49374.1 short-chain dehydrogenase [Dyella japonica A8]